MSLLEVIALTADDARAAEDGGADRIEVVADMAADGLTPTPTWSPRSGRPRRCRCG